MRLPIPSDWDGESWRCIQLQWPDSDRWLWILNGILSQFARGETWKESTGIVAGAQVVGRQIWDRNRGLIACDGAPLPPEIIEIIRHVGCEVEVDCEDDDMSGNCGPNPPVKIENGKLYYWWCCEWYEIGELTDIGDPVEDDIGTTEENPDPVYSACGKTLAIIEAIYAISHAMWEVTDESPIYIPYVSDGWVKLVKEAVPQYSLKDKYIVEGVICATTLKYLDYEEEEVFDVISKQAVICRLMRDMDADPTFDDDDDENLMTALTQNLGFEIAIFQCAGRALGRAQLQGIAAAGALSAIPDSDCECTSLMSIDPTPDWEGFDWSHFWDFRNSQYTASAGNGLTVYVPIQGWVDWADDGTSYVKTAVTLPFTTEQGTITRIWMRIHVGPGFDYAGDKAYIGTDSVTLYDHGVPGGDPVTLGGDLNIDAACSRALGAGDDKITMVGEGHVDGVSGITDPDSFRIIAFAIGGTGADPFS